MDMTTFWNIIDDPLKNSDGNLDEQAELLFETLCKLPEEEISAFETIFHELQNQANRADLWDAANLIRCYCTEDHFWDFRPWLVTRGKVVYEKALENPDSLVDVIDVDFRDDPSFGSFGSVARDAYEFTLNKEFPYHMFKTSDLVGTTYKSEEIPALYPRLAAKLGDCESWWEARLSGGSNSEE